MKKRVTRRQAQAWLAPMRKCINDMRSGFSDAARGYAVTRLHEGDDYVRVDYCIAGFQALIGRLFPNQSVQHMETIRKRLASGVLVSQATLEGALRELREVEDLLITVSRLDLQSAVLTEQISIEMGAIFQEEA